MGIPVVDLGLPAWLVTLFAICMAAAMIAALVKIWRNRDGATLLGLAGLTLTFTSSQLWLFAEHRGPQLFMATAGAVVGVFAMAFWVRIATAEAKPLTGL